ncbi:alpha/beta hydrolase [Anaerococcus rubeinfantis]|uniref:alpha/beta hydrolase n=1 Tax=Anaerococcus rubeinfantis TaxID=1720199 RepID=UPI00073F0BAE|nr:alpha/beta hydrolase-fold protein [Anaerococcus rubeinfantis]
MIKNKMKLMIGVLSLGLVFAGCSNKNDENNSSSDPTIPYSNKASNKSNEKSEISKKDQGKVVEDSINSEILKQNWKYKVYLPNGYDEKSDEKYPVLYMLHGFGENSSSILEKSNTKDVLDKIMKDKEKKMIVVFVDGFTSFFIDSDYDKNMESAIKDELIKEIDENYKTDANKNSRAIGGISVGGYGAAGLSLRNPDLFTKVLLISPTLWDKLDEDSLIRRNYLAFSDGIQNWSDEVYKEKFPTNFINAQSKDINFYIRSAEGDTKIKIDDIEKFNKKLEEAEVNTEFKKDGKEFDHDYDYWNKITEESYLWVLDEFEK